MVIIMLTARSKSKQPELYPDTINSGADKSLARPGRKKLIFL